ncbi:glycosyltransferase family 39 protein [Acetobacter estunensis]|uniref:ArnT family glycosyltransferase n=1 Tax=Acetobacter estunensis TaxID=104097 RepID=UPI001C2D7780|nr:glycosyltransferase family 39 protein [Acetobacter estunensis]
MLKSLIGSVFRSPFLRKLFALGFCAFLLLLPGRASIPPFDRDEPRYMQATAQMLESGNFVDVRFQDQPRYLQPAGIYWLEALAVSASGTLHERAVWAYRLPSLVSMTLAIMLTGWMGSLLFGATAGLSAGVLLAVSVLVQAEGRMATIDSTLLLAVVGAECLIFRVIREYREQKPTSVMIALGFWGILGIGLMLKGPVILVPTLGTLLAFSLIERDGRWLHRLRPAWGWLAMVAVVLPWCAAIEIISHGEFFERAVGRNFLGKIGHGQEAHGAFPGFHLAVFLLAFWPGSFFAAAALPVIRTWWSRWDVRFLVCWIVPHWLVFELIATKLPHYVLPVYPPIAILTAGALCAGGSQWASWPLHRWARIALSAYGFLWALLGIALSVAGIAVSLVFEKHVPMTAWIVAGGALPLWALALRNIVAGRLQRGAMCAVGTAVIVYAGLFSGVIPRLNTIWLAPRLVAAVERQRTCPNMRVISSSFSEPSLVFLMQGHVRLADAHEAAQALTQDKTCTLVLMGRQHQPIFDTTLASLGVQAIERDRVKGFNYSTGKWLDIGVYGARQP